MVQRLHEIDLDNLHAAATRQKFAHPADVIRLVEEVRLLRASLGRIFGRCENWSAADVRAGVADALGATVAELAGAEEVERHWVDHGGEG